VRNAQTSCFSDELDEELSFDDFENGISTQWKNRGVESTPAPASNFTKFLGRYFQGDKFPSRTWEFDNVTEMRKFYVRFNFYEIDSWDGSGRNGPDLFQVLVEGDIEELIDFGAFRFWKTEDNIEGVSGAGIRWFLWGEPHQQIGFEDFEDQRHLVFMEIPSVFYGSGKQVRISPQWVFKGELDESVGIDNFKAARCLCSSFF